jgi:TRAP-type C4-dicarboxylate transport system substrate-binding protein
MTRTAPMIIIPYKIFQLHKYITVWHYAIDPLILGVCKMTWDTFSAADKKMMMEKIPKRRPTSKGRKLAA